MLTALEVLLVLALAASLVALFVRWERGGKEQLVPLVLLGLLIVEATIYADQNTLPRSIFHPGSGSTQLRLPEIYITLALLARLIARGKPNRIGLPAGLWLAFAGWMAVGSVEGWLYHNVLTQNLYEAKDILYIVGAYALAAGVPVRKYLDSGSLYKLGNLSVACASIVGLMTIAGVTLKTNLPGLPLQSFGAVGNESAALFLAVGAMSFLVRLASGSVRGRHVVALVPLVVCVVLADQRAVLMNLVVVLVVVTLAVLVGHKRGIVQRFQVASRQVVHVVLALLAVVGIVTLVVVVPAAVDRKPPRVPLVSSIQKLFHGQGKAESAQDRLNLASEAEALIPQHVFIGSGLGVEFQYYETGTRRMETIAYAHNIVLDLWLRLGLIGVLLFLVALSASVVDGLRAWRRHPDPMTAALALALVAVLAGLFMTALVEPLIDEYRLSTLFGVSLGMLRATVTSMHAGYRAPFGPLRVASGRNSAGGVEWL